MATGYATLYGDMAGRLAVPRTSEDLCLPPVELAQYGESPVILQNIIDRPPSPSLSPTRRTGQPAALRHA